MNTKYHHSKTIARKRNNKSMALKDENINW